MSDFFLVVNEFDTLINNFDFKCPKKLWYRNLIVLNKHIDDVFYCNVVARVRRNDGSLETTLWVGPIDRPDDGLESLSANIKLQIGYNQVLDSSFFRNCEHKIINILREGVLESLVSASKRELEFPSVKNKRYEIYTQHILPTFNRVVERTSSSNKILGNKNKCILEIETILRSCTGETKVFFENIGLINAIDMIWNLCYIHSL